jgi:uncharacterized protein
VISSRLALPIGARNQGVEVKDGEGHFTQPRFDVTGLSRAPSFARLASLEETMAPRRLLSSMVALIAAVGSQAVTPASAAGLADANDVHVDVPVVLKDAKVVFNLDHPAFEGDEPTGLNFMRLMLARFRADHTSARIVAVFHGAIGYMLLDDDAYSRVRGWSRGNPYKDQIAALMAEGVQIEECAETMLDNHWRNADLLPGVKVNTGAILRIVQLVQQDGYVQIQP